MCGLLKFEDLLEFGTLADGVLRIDKTFEFEQKSGGQSLCLIVNALAKYEGKVPHINFELYEASSENCLYKSLWYVIGNDKGFLHKSWRVPPMIWRDMSVKVIVKIPEGTTLYIKNFDADFGAPAQRGLPGTRFNAHLGLTGYIPDNTMESFEMAAAVGYEFCIAVPKVTKDGVFVCIHDDTINRTGRDKDGNKLPEEPMYVWDMTYEELLEYDFAVRKHPVFKGTKIPLLEDFFKLCSKTGMKPMFSTHPALTKEQWEQVKKMLKKYDLLKHFHIKGGISVIPGAYEVMGDEIDGYTVDIQKLLPDTIEKFDAIGVDRSRCRTVIEMRQEKVEEEDVKKVLEAGYTAAIWNMVHSVSFTEYERFIEWGVTEFTEDRHCSMGLNF